MPTYSTDAIIYIASQSLSLLLLLWLMWTILQSESDLKWIMFQMYISAFGNGIAGYPLIIIYGDELTKRAFETPLCIIQQKFSLFFLYPLQFFSYVLAFHLWYALVRKANIGKKYIKYISALIWSHTTIFNAVLLKYAAKEKNWGVLPSPLNCRTSNIASSFYGFIILTSILALFGFLMTCHSAWKLYERWSHFSVHKNRRTAIRLGEAVRLWIWCFTFAISLAFSLVPRVIQGESSISGSLINITKISNYHSALTGTILFLIFGTNRKAAFFLPCYYSPPEKLRQPPYDINNINIIMSDTNITSDENITSGENITGDENPNFGNTSSNSGNTTLCERDMSK